jgi:hypothetical protein
MFKTNDIYKEKQKRLAVTKNSRLGKFSEPPQIKQSNLTTKVC